MTLFPVSISLGSYGADTVRRQGQASFVPLLAAAGVSYIELREELGLPGSDAFVQANQATRLTCVYSAPLELWCLGQAAPNPALATALEQAQRYGAVWLKVSLGHFGALSDLQALAQQLRAQPVHLLVENDQTEHGGKIEPLQRFFDQARAQQVPVGMTFDVGNWHWQDQSVARAAQVLGGDVQYLHCKAVQRTDGKLHAVPPDAGDLQAWDGYLRHMRRGIVRAVEFPLQGDDLLQVTGEQVRALASLGQTAEETTHG
jgi:sugar phosphate isomerase/epimerase